jgi:hypothetical protein
MEDAGARSPDSDFATDVKSTCRCKVAQPVMPVMPVMLDLGQGPASSRLGKRTHGHDGLPQGDVGQTQRRKRREVRKRRGQSNVGSNILRPNTIFGHVTMDPWG